MFDHLLWIGVGVGGTGAAIFAYEVSKKGLAWGVAKIKAWWTAGKSDLASLHSDVATLKTDMANVKAKVGL